MNDSVPPLRLERRDPARNMQRFYRLAVCVDLFGELLVMRHWGRIGTHGREKAERVADMAAARLRLAALEKAKRRRGYGEVAGGR